MGWTTVWQGREPPGSAHIWVNSLEGYPWMDPMTIVHNEFNRNDLRQEEIG